MTPEERTEFDELKAIVAAIRGVKDVSFIQELKRRALADAAKIGDTLVATTITQAVRNSADTGSINVAKVPDGKTAIIDAFGNIKYVATYNS